MGLRHRGIVLAPDDLAGTAWPELAAGPKDTAKGLATGRAPPAGLHLARLHSRLVRL